MTTLVHVGAVLTIHCGLFLHCKKHIYSQALIHGKPEAQSLYKIPSSLEAHFFYQNHIHGYKVISFQSHIP